MTSQPDLSQLEGAPASTEQGENALLTLSTFDRVRMYSAIATATMAKPDDTPDWALDILSYGFFKDFEAQDFALGTPYQEALEYNFVGKVIREEYKDWGVIARLVAHSEYVDKDVSVPLGNVPVIGGLMRTLDGIRFDDEWMGVISPPVLLAAWLTGRSTGEIVEGVQQVSSGGLETFTGGPIGVTPFDASSSTGFGAGQGFLWDAIRNMDENEKARVEAVAQGNIQRTLIDLRNAGVESDLPPGWAISPEGNVLNAVGEQVPPSEYAGIPDPTKPPPEIVGNQGLIDDPYWGIDPNLNPGWAPETYAFEPSGSGVSTFQPKYRHSDMLEIIGAMTPEQLMTFQGQAVQAGLIDPESTRGGQVYLEGVRGPQTMDALRSVLTTSNITPGNDYRTWQTTLDELEQIGIEAGVGVADPRPSYIRRTYLPPDYASLAQIVKGDADRKLGRPLSSWEVQLLTDELSKQHRATFNAEEQVRQQDFEAQQAQQFDEFAAPKQDVTIPDWESRYDEAFDKHFKPEVQRGERLEDVETQEQNLFSSFNVARSLIGR